MPTFKVLTTLARQTGVSHSSPTSYYAAYLGKIAVHPNDPVMQISLKIKDRLILHFRCSVEKLLGLTLELELGENCAFRIHSEITSRP